jgi:hypothetical protein
MFAILAQASSEELKQGWGGLIFMGLFFLALIIAGIWWLKRSA